MSHWKAWRSFLLRKAFFVQGFGLFPSPQVSKQICCLPVLPVSSIWCCKMRPLILYTREQVAVAKSQDFHPFGMYGHLSTLLQRCFASAAGEESRDVSPRLLVLMLSAGVEPRRCCLAKGLLGQSVCDRIPLLCLREPRAGTLKVTSQPNSSLF